MFLFILACAGMVVSCQKKTVQPDAGMVYGITGIEPQLAPSGDTVTVFGVGFAADTNGNTLSIHGVPARIVSAQPTSLQVIVPAAPGLGTIQATTGSQSYSYSGAFTVATLITGVQTTSQIWTPDHFYLLSNHTEFAKGTRLTILAGTSILCDHDSLASVVFDDGAFVSMNGTAANPIVFCSSSPASLRYPGDWGGITLAGGASAGADTLHYVRIEYAGNHPSNQPGAALEIDRSEPAGVIQYVQTSYSGGDGFRAAGAGTTLYLDHLIAFGDAGNDFSFEGNTRVLGQYFLGLKDPLYADQLSADGLLVQSALPVTLSNITLVGYDGLARKSTTVPQFLPLYDFALNNNSGRVIHVGGVPRGTGGAAVGGVLQLFNSLAAATWLAGISFDGPVAWSQYEAGPSGSTVRYTSFTYSVDGSGTQQPTLYPPKSGYTLSMENISSPSSGFEPVDPTGAPYDSCFTYNDSSELELAQLYSGPGIDNLGIQMMVDVNRLHAPFLALNLGSFLLTQANFSDARLADPFFDRSPAFSGAFGLIDWTTSWSNYVPESTIYP